MLLFNNQKFGVEPVISGPNPGTSGQLAAGTAGTFRITSTNWGCDPSSGYHVGFDVAASDGTMASAANDNSTRIYNQGEQITNQVSAPRWLHALETSWRS